MSNICTRCGSIKQNGRCYFCTMDKKAVRQADVRARSSSNSRY